MKKKEIANVNNYGEKKPNGQHINKLKHNIHTQISHQFTGTKLRKIIFLSQWQFQCSISFLMLHDVCQLQNAMLGLGNGSSNVRVVYRVSGKQRLIDKAFE